MIYRPEVWSEHYRGCGPYEWCSILETILGLLGHNPQGDT